MRIKEVGEGFDVAATAEEVRALAAALNEVCNGVEIPGFETRLGTSREDVERLLSVLNDAYRTWDRRQVGQGQVKAIEDEWACHPGLALNDELLERLRKTIEDVSPIIVEHRFYRGSSAPHRFVCDSYEDLATYLRSRTRAGDSFHFWEYESCCTDDNFLAHGKVPDSEGKVPRRGVY